MWTDDWYSMNCKLRRADERGGTTGLVEDYRRSRRGDDARKKRESARCTIIDHSSTKNKIKSMYPESLKQRRDPTKNSGKLLVSHVEPAFVGSLSTTWYDTVMKPYKIVLYSEQSATLMTAPCNAVLYEPYQSDGCAPDSAPIGYVVTILLLCSNWLQYLLSRGNVAIFNTIPRWMEHEVKFLFKYQIELPNNLVIMYPY